MAHTYCDLTYHVVFSTKHRRPIIDDELQPELWKYLGGIIKGLEGRPLMIGGISDHVHLLITLPPTACVSDALRVLKANSSGWVHRQGPTRSAFAWQSGYAAFTVSQSQRETVTRYIANQAKHHQQTTFQEELLALLQRHGVDFDPRHVWD